MNTASSGLSPTAGFGTVTVLNFPAGIPVPKHITLYGVYRLEFSQNTKKTQDDGRCLKHSPSYGNPPQSENFRIAYYQISIFSRFYVTIDGVLDSRLDLLTTLTRDT
jgi:hypothetical protein